MLGNVFSPYYAFARRHNPAEPLNHCAINVALYGPRSKHWAMTERPRHDIQRTPIRLTIGPSSVSCDAKSITFMIDEVCVPLPTRIKGRVRVFPSGMNAIPTALHPAGLHWWLPIAPSARVEVDFDDPRKTWTGDGYLDCNFGQQPLEAAFKQWNWARGQTKQGSVILYNVETREGDRISLARLYDMSGRMHTLPPRGEAKLPNTRWHIKRKINSDDDTQPRILKTFEDTPFYARSLIETTLFGSRTTMVHESLCLDRFANPVIRSMLPFRMPRWRHSKKPRPSEGGTK
ncbi:hypothetical protein [Hyphomicrobium sp.]|jgi:carotenoid 1,2-hydratase|uniref:hypothetical protein n=1 Tax=Hyphomicrobium sp. TaxID=82 RepID=UPI00356B4FEE